MELVPIGGSTPTGKNPSGGITAREGYRKSLQLLLISQQG